MPTPLTIRFVVPYFYPAWAYGGIPRIAYGLARALVQEGHRVQVLTTDALDEHNRLPSGEMTVEGIEVHRLPNLSNHLAYQHQGFLPRGLMPTLARAPKPDLYHIHGHRHLLGVGAHRVAKAQGVPIVLTPNGTLPNIERKAMPKRIFDRLMGDAIPRDADQLIAVSRAEVAQFRQWGLPAGKVSLIPNGLDLGEFEALPDKAPFLKSWGIGPGQVILYLGKITPRKGLDHLIEAFALLGRGDVSLIIAGNDMTGLLPSLKELAQERGVGARVHFLGLLTGVERLAALAAADVLAYPSNLEIFGLVPFEGLLAGAPAVVGDDCGCGELVQAANAGLLVRYGDAHALKAALKRLLEDPEDRAARVARGRHYIRQHFSWQRVAAQTLQVYGRALSSSALRGEGHP